MPLQSPPCPGRGAGREENTFFLGRALRRKIGLCFWGFCYFLFLFFYYFFLAVLTLVLVDLSIARAAGGLLTALNTDR